MLENDVIGPLYKTILRRPKPVGFREHMLEFAVGPSALSVTKINQDLGNLKDWLPLAGVALGWG
jgi:hypothetical protein